MFSASCKVGFATEKELFETPGGWVEQGECVHAICTSNRTDQSKYIFVLHVQFILHNCYPQNIFQDCLDCKHITMLANTASAKQQKGCNQQARVKL